MAFPKIAKPNKTVKEDRVNSSVGTLETNGRIYIFFIAILLVSGLIVIRLYSLQVLAYDAYKTLAADQHSVYKKLVPDRGEVFLKEKNDLYPAAVNRETKMAYAVPKEMKDSGEVAEKISAVLGLDEGELRKKFSNPEDMYEVLKHRLSDEEIEKVREMKLDGVHLAEESFRYYPAGELASHILGFVGWRDKEFGGRYGVEASFEEKLRGREGQLFQNKDNSGRWITLGAKDISYADDGDTLVLTVDHIIQYETEKILKGAMEKHQADGGAIIVMEPETGKILAMTSYPYFNPNEYASVENMEAFRNLALSGSYESGSVFKTFTLAAAIDAGRVSPDSTYVDTGEVHEAGYTIKNSDYKAYGKQTMTEVLENSLNTGVIYAEETLGNKNFADYVKRFGFGELTGIALPGESAGNIKNLNNLNSDIQFFTASFGQGITVTPIQLAAAYNAIASSGVLYKPQIVERIIHSDGTEEEVRPQEERRVISQKTALEVGKMLRSVVVRGHGKRADVPGYLVGGKTGTAQVASTESKGYEEGKSIGSFAGFAPVDNPRFTIVVRIDNPKDVEWAESSAAPVFGELMKFLLEYAGIEPTETFTEKDLEKFNDGHTIGINFMEKEIIAKEEAEKNKE